MDAKWQRVSESIGLAVLIGFGLAGADVMRGVYAGIFVIPLFAVMVYRLWPWLQTRREEARADEARRSDLPRWQDALKNAAMMLAVFIAVYATVRRVFPETQFDAWTGIPTLCFLAIPIYVQWPRWTLMWQRRGAGQSDGVDRSA